MTSAGQAGRERNNICRTGAKNEKIQMIRDGVRDIGEKNRRRNFFFRPRRTIGQQRRPHVVVIIFIDNFFFVAR